MTPPRAGIALLLAVLLLLLLGVLSTGMLTIATHQVRAAAAIEDRERARLAAENAAVDAFAAWSTRDHLGDAVGAVPPPGSSEAGPGTGVVVERLNPGLFMLRARARIGAALPGGALAHIALLVRAVTPEEVLAGFPAALTTPGPVTVRAGATIDGMDADRMGVDSGPCPGEAAQALEHIFGGRSTPGIATAPDMVPDIAGSVTGVPAIRRVPGLRRPPEASLGPVPWDRITALAQGSGPDPAVLRHAGGDLVVRGGTGQGILVVEGNLVLTDSARFHGVILVRGHVQLARGASVYGAIRSGTGATLDTAALAFRVCPIWRAVTLNPALDRAFRPEGRWWVPDFPPEP